MFAYKNYGKASQWNTFLKPRIPLCVISIICTFKALDNLASHYRCVRPDRTCTPHKLMKLQCSAVSLRNKSDLRNGTEVEDALVAEAGQVCDDVWDVVEGIGHQQVEAGQSGAQVLRMSEILQTLRELTPGLRSRSSRHSHMHRQT